MRVFLEELDLHYKIVELRVDDVHLVREKTTLSIPCPLSGLSCNREFRTDEKLVFVGLPFSATSIDLFTFAIAPALQKLGLKPRKADEAVSFPLFCNICRVIRECKFAVIDISEANPNIMFELGIAAAIGKRVVMTKNQKSQVPIDLAGFAYIEYANLQNLQEDLYAWIRRLQSSGELDQSSAPVGAR